MNKIEIGRANGRAVTLDLVTLLRTRALIQANSGGGKSWLLRLLAEQLFGKVPVWIVDPEGEFASLREKFGYVLVGQGGETPADPRSVELVVHRLLEHGASAIFDLYSLKPQTRHHYVRLLCEALMNAPKSLWKNLVFKLDEAHRFAPEKGQGESEATSAVTDVATAGRKRGFCLMAYTQRLSKITKNVTAELLNRMVGMTFEDLDVDSAAGVLSVPKADREAFKHQIKRLDPGNFFGLGPAISRDRLLFLVGNVKTTHPEPGTTAAAAPPPAPEKIKHLLPKLADLPKEAETKAKTESELRAEISRLKMELSAKPRAVAPAPTSKVATREVIRSRLIEVPALGKRPVNAIRKTSNRALQVCALLTDMVTKLIEARAGFESGAGKISDALERFLKMPQTPTHATPPPRAHPAPTPPRAAQPPVAPARRQVPSPTNGEHVDALSKCHRAILTVLAQYPEGCPIGKISLLAGYKKSGTFMSTLSNLRTSGFMIGENSGTMKVTREGLEALGEFDPLPAVGRDLANYWINHPSFDKCERNILEKLVENPDGLTIGEISEATGYSQSGTFMSSLSSLRTAGVLVGKNSERMRVSENIL